MYCHKFNLASRCNAVHLRKSWILLWPLCITMLWVTIRSLPMLCPCTTFPYIRIHSKTLPYYLYLDTMMQVLTCVLTCCHSIPLSSPHVSHLRFVRTRRTTQRNHDARNDFTASLRPSEMASEVQLSWSPHTIARILHGKNVNLGIAAFFDWNQIFMIFGRFSMGRIIANNPILIHTMWGPQL